MKEFKRFQSGRLVIEPKMTADLRGFGSPTGRLGQQAMLYAQGLFESYRHCQPMPVGEMMGEAVLRAEEAFLRRYSPGDIDYTMRSWGRMWGQPVLVNRFRAKDDQPMSYNDLIRPETLAVMGRPIQQMPPTQGRLIV